MKSRFKIAFIIFNALSLSTIKAAPELSIYNTTNSIQTVDMSSPGCVLAFSLPSGGQQDTDLEDWMEVGCVVTAIEHSEQETIEEQPHHTQRWELNSQQQNLFKTAHKITVTVNEHNLTIAFIPRNEKIQFEFTR